MRWIKKKKVELIDLICGFVQCNLNNKKFIKGSREEFLSKGLNVSIPNLVWSDSIDLEKLDEIELMALAKGINKVSSNDNEKIQKEDTFNLKYFFSAGELETYKNFKNQNEKINTIYLEDVIKISDKDYHSIITAEQLSDIRRNGLVGYFKKYQRAGINKKTKKGKIIEKIAVNKEGILEMQARFLDKTNDKPERKFVDIRPTSIAFTVLLDELTDTSDSFIFKEKYNTSNIGDLAIKPDFDIDNENALKLIISDGMHRFTSLADAFDIARNEGKYLDEKIGLYIHIMTPTEATQYLHDVFKRNDTSIDYLKSIESSMDSEFINKFEKESKWLYGHVALSKREMNADKNFVEQKTLVEGFRNTDINMSLDLNDSLNREKVATILDSILNFAFKELYNENSEAFRNSIFLNKNIFKLYIMFAARVRKTKYLRYIEKLVFYINDTEDLKYKLEERNYSDLDKVFETIIELVVSDND